MLGCLSQIHLHRVMFFQNFGNMALFLQASLLLNEPAYKDIVYQKINKAFDKYQNFEKILPGTINNFLPIRNLISGNCATFKS